MPDNPELFWTAGALPGSVPIYLTHVTLRDLFAAAALAGLCANPHLTLDHETISIAAFAVADATLRARENRNERESGGE